MGNTKGKSGVDELSSMKTMNLDEEKMQDSILEKEDTMILEQTLENDNKEEKIHQKIQTKTSLYLHKRNKHHFQMMY